MTNTNDHTTTELLGIARFDFTGGDVAEFKRLSAEAMAIVRAQEPGTIRYDTYFSADETACVVLEGYVDSQALLDHAEHMAPLMEAIMATAASIEGELLGTPNAELAAKIADSPVRLLALYAAK